MAIVTETAAEVPRAVVLLCLPAENARPARGDVRERLDEAVGAAARGGMRVCFAEGREVGVEGGAVVGLEGVEPAAAGEEPIACIAVAECPLVRSKHKR